MQNSSDSGMTFGFNKPNTEINKQTIEDSVQSPVEVVNTVQQPTTSKIDIEKGDDREDLSENQPYTDVRSITIMLVKNTSLYRKVMIKYFLNVLIILEVVLIRLRLFQLIKKKSTHIFQILLVFLLTILLLC